ncbi:MAG: FadR/GntR family transcriptional regulator [Ignavibacteriales bacterium]
MSSIEKIVKPSGLPETIAKKIVSLIRAGDLEPGARLPSEKEMCEALGVSRSSVREALQALEYLGVIESKQGVGKFLSVESRRLAISLDWNHALNTAPLFELMEAREYLEGLVASLAAQRATSEDIAGLESTLAAVQRWAGKDQDKFFRAELGFHLAMAKACGNSVLCEMVGVVMNRVYAEAERFLRTTLETSKTAGNLLSALLGAIKDGDSKRASDLMMEHLLAVRLVLAEQNCGPKGNADGR